MMLRGGSGCAKQQGYRFFSTFSRVFKVPNRLQCGYNQISYFPRLSFSRHRHRHRHDSLVLVHFLLLL